jgi:hypothetical protein
MEKIPGADVSDDRSTTTKLSDSEGGKVVALKRIYVTSSPDRIQNEIAILHDLRYQTLKSTSLKGHCLVSDLVPC